MTIALRRNVKNKIVKDLGLSQQGLDTREGVDLKNSFSTGQYEEKWIFNLSRSDFILIINMKKHIINVKLSTSTVLF